MMHRIILPLLLLCFSLLLSACGTLSQTSAPVGDKVYLSHATLLYPQTSIASGHREPGTA